MAPIQRKHPLATRAPRPPGALAASWPWLAVLVLAAVVATVPGSVAAQDGAVRIGYVDMQRLIDNAPQVVQARERLQREFAERNTQLDRDQERLAQMQARQRREGALMDPEDADQLTREIDALRRAIERTRERLQQELGRRVDQELLDAWPAMEAAVAAYAREAGYDLVLSSPQLYASGRIDITDRVLDRLRRAAATEANR